MTRFLPFLLVAYFAAMHATGQVRVDVGLVNVTATVTDDKGNFLRGLTAEDFIVEEDGKRQTIAYFDNSPDVPVRIGIILDNSPSMVAKLNYCISALVDFIRNLPKADEVFIVTSSPGHMVLQQDFTTDQDGLSRVLQSVVAVAGDPEEGRKRIATSSINLGTAGGTALNDAIILALQKMNGQSQSFPKAVIVISDGTGQEYTRPQAVTSAIQHSDATVYNLIVSLVRSLGATGIRSDGLPVSVTVAMPNKDLFDALARLSGGKASVVYYPDMSLWLKNIDAGIRAHYTVSYYPDHRLDDGMRHRIRVRMRRSKQTVRARTEYSGGS